MNDRIGLSASCFLEINMSQIYSGHWNFRSVIGDDIINEFLVRHTNRSLPLASVPLNPLDGITKSYNPFSLGYEGGVFNSFIYNIKLISLIKSVSGSSKVRPIQVGLLTKFPGAPATPWHRDRDHLPISTNVYTAWIALTVVEGSSSLVYAEGTARIDPVITQVKSGNSLQSILQEYGNPLSTPVEMYAGDVDIHDGHVWHYGPPNYSDTMRHAIAIAYVPEGCCIELSPRGFDSIAGFPMRLSIMASNFPGLSDGDLIDLPFNNLI